MRSGGETATKPGLIALFLATWIVAVPSPSRAASIDLLVNGDPTHTVLRDDATTGAFVDSFVSGGGLNGPRGLAFIPEPGAGTLLGVGFALMAIHRRHRPGRSA